MSQSFPFDVFLSHSAKDKAVVRSIAGRLRADGLDVWFDDSGASTSAEIEEGLEHSRVLVLCMSANAFGSDWAQLEAATFRFRDPLNNDLRFLPLRLDDATAKGSLAQFLHIDWRPEAREREYAKLLEACRPPAQPTPEQQAARERLQEKIASIAAQSTQECGERFAEDAPSSSPGHRPMGHSFSVGQTERADFRRLKLRIAGFRLRRPFRLLPLPVPKRWR